MRHRPFASFFFVAALSLAPGGCSKVLEEGNPQVEVTPGRVRVAIAEPEPTAGLVVPGTVLPGVFGVKTGG